MTIHISIPNTEPTRKMYKNFLASKSPIILPKFSQKLAENRPIFGSAELPPLSETSAPSL